MIKHILEDYSTLSGGLRTVVQDLHQNLLSQSIDSEIVTTNTEQEDKVKFFKRSLYKGIWCYSNNLKSYLNFIEKEYIYHIHGVWMYPQYIASKIAYKNQIPYIITPHGMFEPWLWKNGTLKKKLYFNLMIKKYFSHANYLHAITPNEKENLFNLFGHKNIVLIPNLISYTEILNKNIQKEEVEKYILYLGRLDSIKGIDLLIKAYSKIKVKNIKLKIAGPFNDYKNYLEKLVKNLDLTRNVEFLGMVTGDEKIKLYKNAWVFVAPSHSEVIGMVNLEAGILKTPVITTYQTGLYSQWNENGGILINPNIEELINALKESLSWSEDERDDRGNRLQAFIIKEYSWEKNIFKWIELYKELENAKIK